TLATNLVAAEQVAGSIVATQPGRSVPTTSASSSSTVTFYTNFGTIDGYGGSVTVNGQIHNGGTFNGTPWYSYVDSSAHITHFVFEGDLIIPDNTTIKGVFGNGVSGPSNGL